jgi:cytochrome c-type biogenesis protein CcmF
MTIHPPMLYFGYISTTIPFAFAIAALLQGKLDTGWIHAIRKWTITSWIFLSVAITLGMKWAYVELGWGGYWAWDPVENASLLPWLTMTAFLHSVMIQEKRGMLKRWNVALVAASFFLTIFGTFITRSGVIQSVHSFAQSNVGTWFLGFLIVAGVLTYTLLYVRWPRLEPEVPLESMVSREAAFLFNNVILVGIAFSVLWGTVFPIVSEWVTGTKITVGVPFFNRVNAPLGLGLLALTGIGPLIAWRKASAANLQRQFIFPVITGVSVLGALLAAGMRDGYALTSFALAAFTFGTIVQEYGRGVRARMRMHREDVFTAIGRLVARNRRRYGGYLVHVGVLLYFVGFAGQAFVVQKQANLKPGESVTLKSPFGYDYTFTHLGISQYKQANRMTSAASTRITRDGKPDGVMTSEKRQHFTTDASGNEVPSFEPSTEIGLRTDLREDVYIVFAGAIRGADGVPSEEASYRININPLVMWVWIGCLFLFVGGIITMWPGSGATALASERKGEGGYRVAMAGAAQ